MPNRIIKESLTTSAGVDRLTAEEERFFTRLIVTVDDFGRIDARLPLLRAKCFPLKDLRDEQVKPWLEGIVTAGLARIYQNDGRTYLELTGWTTHQRTPRAKASKCPDPPWLRPKLRNPHADDSGPQTNAPVNRESGIENRESRFANRESEVSGHDPVLSGSSAPAVPIVSPLDRNEGRQEPMKGYQQYVVRTGAPVPEEPEPWIAKVGECFHRNFGKLFAGRELQDCRSRIERGETAHRIIQAYESVFGSIPRPRMPHNAAMCLLDSTPIGEKIRWKTKAELEAAANTAPAPVRIRDNQSRTE